MEKSRQCSSQLANALLPVASSELPALSWSVTWLLWASIVHFFPSLCLSFAFAAIFNGINTKVGIHASQISAPSLQPYLTITISFTVLHNLVPTFPVCSPVFSLSAFYRMRFCCSAPNKFTEHVINTGDYAFDTKSDVFCGFGKLGFLCFSDDYLNS